MADDPLPRRWYQLDNKPVWVIVLVALLGAIGAGVGKYLVEETGQLVGKAFPVESKISIYLKDSKSHAQIKGAQVLFLDAESGQYLPVDSSKAKYATTNDQGFAKLSVKPERGVSYSIELRRTAAGGSYKITLPVTIADEITKEVSFDDQWAFNQGKKPEALAGVPHLPPLNADSAAWMKIAYRELGQHEAPGPVGNPRIREYLKGTGFENLDETAFPWSALFVNWVMQRAGYQGTHSAEGRRLLAWGKPVQPPTTGCIAVFWRNNPSSGQTHPGFYVGDDGESMLILGGSQHDEVSVAKIPKSQFLGCRLPT